MLWYTIQTCPLQDSVILTAVRVPTTNTSRLSSLPAIALGWRKLPCPQPCHPGQPRPLALILNNSVGPCILLSSYVIGYGLGGCCTVVYSPCLLPQALFPRPLPSKLTFSQTYAPRWLPREPHYSSNLYHIRCLEVYFLSATERKYI